MIVRAGSRYKIRSHTTGKNLGTYSTVEAAKRRLQQIAYFKHKKPSQNAS